MSVNGSHDGSDEHYAPQQPLVASASAQPAPVERMSTVPRLAQLGTVAGLLAIVTSIAALLTWPDSATDRTWAVVCLLVSVVMAALAAFQIYCWRRALAVWRGERSEDLRTLTRLSWVAHLVSYAVVLLGLWAGIAGSIAAGTASTAAALLAFALLFLLLAQVLGAVQYLRTAGPPGTIPGHLRRLGAAIEARR